MDRVQNVPSVFSDTIARVQQFLGSHPEILYSTVICSVIFLAFYYGMRNISKENQWLTREKSILDYVVQRCRALLADPSRPQEDLKIHLLEQYVDTPCFARDRVLDVARVTQGGGVIHPEVMGASLALRLRYRISRIQYLSNSLILLGLTGTLIGLTLAVIGLKPPEVPQGVEEAVRRAKEVAGLYRSITTTLGGMRTAFLASLAAVVGTVVLNLRFSRLKANQESFLADMEDFTALELVPLFRPPTSDISLTKLADSFDKSSGLMETFSRHINDQVVETRANVQTFLAAVRQLDSGRDSIARGVEGLLAGQTQLLETQQNVTDTVQRLGDSLGHLALVGPRTDAMISEISKILQEQKNLLSGIDSMTTAANLMVETNRDFLKKQDDIVDRRLAGLLGQTQTQIREVLRKEATHIQVVQERLDSLVKAQGSMSASLTQKAQDERNLALSVNEYLEYRRGQQVTFEQELLGSLQAFRSMVEKQPHHEEEITQSLQQLIVALEGREKQWEGSFAAQQSAYAELLELKLAGIKGALEELTKVTRWNKVTRWQPAPARSRSELQAPPSRGPAFRDEDMDRQPMQGVQSSGEEPLPHNGLWFRVRQWLPGVGKKAGDRGAQPPSRGYENAGPTPQTPVASRGSSSPEWVEPTGPEAPEPAAPPQDQRDKKT
jgi:hypothetical protein